MTIEQLRAYKDYALLHYFEKRYYDNARGQSEVKKANGWISQVSHIFGRDFQSFIKASMLDKNGDQEALLMLLSCLPSNCGNIHIDFRQIYQNKVPSERVAAMQYLADSTGKNIVCAFYTGLSNNELRTCENERIMILTSEAELFEKSGLLIGKNA